MPDSAELRSHRFSESLRRGAQNAVTDCLSVTRDDTVTLVSDEKSLTIAASLLERIDEAGSTVNAFILERRGARPLHRLPTEIVRALGRSTVSIYTAHPQEGEHTHRKELIGLVGPNQLRHAHMLGASEDSMVQGMLSDYRRVAMLNALMVERLRRLPAIRVTSPKGTDVTVELEPGERIFDAAGLIAPGTWENLPSGEVFTCPRSVDGVFICDSLPPTEEPVDRFELGLKPLRIEIARGRLVSMSGGPENLAKRVLATIRSGTNVDRIGMFGVGTNYELLMPIGDRIQDQFVPGAYFSFGRPASTVATSWTSTQQLTFSARKTSLRLGTQLVIDGGRYAPEILEMTRIHTSLPPLAY